MRSPLPDTLANMKTGTALWWVTPALVLALDERLGPPVDSYVNGSQTWFTGDDQILEWRLHPVGGFEQPDGVMHEELWERVVTAITVGNPGDAMDLGRGAVALSELWDGLECYPAYADELEPATIAGRAEGAPRDPGRTSAGSSTTSGSPTRGRRTAASRSCTLLAEQLQG